MGNRIITRIQKQWLNKESAQWTEQGLISQEQRTLILSQYSGQPAEAVHSSWSSILLISLGAILIGGGVVLLVAHNWEDFGKGTRTVLSILPLVLAQLFAWYGFRYKPQSRAISEASGILLFFAVAASISLISQTYHIYGDLERFLVTWLLLGIPILYLLNSAGALLLVCALILWLCGLEREPYWLYYLALLPFLYRLYQQQRHILFHWALWFVVIGCSFSIVYSVRWDSPLEDMMIFICLLIAIFYYCLGKWLFGLQQHAFWGNALSSVGAMTIAVIALLLTWDPSFNISYRVMFNPFEFNDYLVVGVAVLSAVGLTIYIIKCWRQLGIEHWALISSLLLAVLGLLGPQLRLSDDFFVILANFYVLIASVLLMGQGISQQRLMLLNGGLLWFSFLVLFRFFDSDIPFVIKGIIFIVIGCAFLGINLWYNKRLKNPLSAEEGSL